MTVGDSAGAEVAGNAEFALLARFGALPRKLFGVARVVNQTRALQSLDYLFHQRFVFRAPLQRQTHLVNRMRSAHQCAQRGVVEIGFRAKLAGRAEHWRKDRGRSGEWLEASE